MKVLKFLLFAILITSLPACTDDGDENNNEKSGILGTYAGVMTGSSGYYSIEVGETSSVAEINFDGQQYNLTNPTPIEPDIDYAELTFTNGTVSAVLTAEVGVTPIISFNIPGHLIQSTISYAFVGNLTLYEGTSSSTNGSEFYNATYNLSLTDRGDCDGCKVFKILEKTTGSSYPDQIGNRNTVNGKYEINGSTITFKKENSVEIVSGTIDGNTISHSEQGFEYSFQFQFTEKKQLQLGI
jgi:hypothetical protein